MFLHLPSKSHIISNLLQRCDLNTLYITSSFAVSSMLLYYFSSWPLDIYINENVNINLYNTIYDMFTCNNKKRILDVPSKTTLETALTNPYENKYYDKFDELVNEDLDEEYVKSLKNNVLYEVTPAGGVVMYYDLAKESFIYYCDKKDISYLYLETVARKYAVTYRCKQIVYDMKFELNLAKENSIKNDSKSTGVIDGNNAKTQDTLFASFKSYNRKGSGGSKTVNKKFILRQHANRYTHSGRVGNFPFLNKRDYKVKDSIDTMDYETFKKLTLKKN